MIISRSSHVAENGIIFFQCLNNIPFIYLYHIFFIQVVNHLINHTHVMKPNNQESFLAVKEIIVLGGQHTREGKESPCLSAESLPYASLPLGSSWVVDFSHSNEWSNLTEGHGNPIICSQIWQKCWHPENTTCKYASEIRTVLEVLCLSLWGCVCMLSHFTHVQLFATLGTVACQAPLSMEFSRQEYWSGLPCPPPGDLPDPGIEPESLLSPALPLEPPH